MGGELRLPSYLFGGNMHSPLETDPKVLEQNEAEQFRTLAATTTKRMVNDMDVYAKALKSWLVHIEDKSCQSLVDDILESIWNLKQKLYGI
jgi:hypothetical protein